MDRPEPVALEEARVDSVALAGMGDRVCIDTASMLAVGEGAPSIQVGEVATSPVGTAWKPMAEHNVRRVYVVEGGAIVGRVTQTGLFQKLLEAFLTLPQLVSLR
ncbi:MAG: 3-dehydroquinate synthase II [Nitrososphaeria archaeon]